MDQAKGLRALIRDRDAMRELYGDEDGGNGADAMTFELDNMKKIRVSWHITRPGYYGSYFDPPEPPEFEIDRVEFESAPGVWKVFDYQLIDRDVWYDEIIRKIELSID